MKIELEIFPTKLDYKEDYINILNDVTNEVYNLAFEFVKKTYINASMNNETKSSNTEFFSILKVLYNNFINSLDFIINTPHHILKSNMEILPAHKIKHTNNKTIKWLEQHSNFLKINNNTYNMDKALGINRQVTYDTTENRFVKFMIVNILKKIKQLCNDYNKLDRNKDIEIINNLNNMIREIENKIRYSFFNSIGETHYTISLIFKMGLGYKKLYDCYLMLLKGLSIHSDIFHISIKDLSLLYEYWCFIKINSIIKQKYNIIKQDIINTDNSGMFVTLKIGKASKIVYENSHNDRIELIYNSTSFNLPTVPQRPDIILSIFKKNSNMIYKYIFDAKYKLNTAIEGTYYNKIYTSPGPEEDDINTMHRYRDALVNENEEYRLYKRSIYERTMFGAYILFPYNKEDEYIEHRFYKSITKVNIGGLPFLPNSTYLVSNLINKLIEDYSENIFEKIGLPVGIYSKLENIYEI